MQSLHAYLLPDSSPASSLLYLVLQTSSVVLLIAQQWKPNHGYSVVDCLVLAVVTAVRHE